MHYDYQVNTHRRRKFLKAVYILIISLAVIAGIFTAIVKIDEYLQKSKNNKEKTTSEQTTAYFAPSTKIFRTQYFQFQANSSWTEIPSESSVSKFVYRSLNNTLIQEELTIYVNDIPADLSATRVLPVTLKENNQFSPQPVSEHCLKSLPGSVASDVEVSLQSVRMFCNADSTQYEVLVGLVGGTSKITLTRPDGTTAIYTIFSRNVRATPDPTQLNEIVSSFQTR